MQIPRLFAFPCSDCLVDFGFICGVHRRMERLQYCKDPVAAVVMVPVCFYKEHIISR